jgi:transposase
MGTKKVFLRVRRSFSEEFRKARVKEYEKGEFTVKELSQLYGISESIIYLWIYKYSIYNHKKSRVVEMEDSSYKKVKDLQERVKELERIVGQKQLNIDFLEKMIEIAKEQYGVDIKKNFNTPPSGGSGSNTKKQG